MRRKQMLLLGALGVVVVVVAVVAAMIGTPPQRAEGPRPEAPIRKQFGTQETSVSEKDIWRTQEGARVSQLQDGVSQIHDELKELREKLKAADAQRKLDETRKADEERARVEQEVHRASQAGATSVRPMLPPPQNALPVQPGGTQAAPAVAPSLRTAGQLGVPGAVPGAGPGLVMGPDGQPVEALRGIVKFEVSKDTSPGSAGSTVGTKSAGQVAGVGEGDRGRRQTTENYLPTGAFLRATNLGGLDAPTGGQVQQNPHPIIFRVVDFANLPNKFRADYKECFVTGNGYGDLSAERAYIRLDRLSCIAEDGAAIDVAVKGYVAGEDGKAGMRGRLVSKQGAVLANALVAGVAAGIGSAFVQSNTTVSTSALGTTSTVDPNKAMAVGVGQGVGKALDKLANYYIQLSEKMFPIIEIDSGREVDLVITRGISIER